MKYIAITGGVLSGVGKGVVASSVGCILKSLGFKVTFIKIDPYLNVDARFLKPSDHGEVFVLSDGGEVDLDFGNYERFMHINLTKDNNLTTGKIYQEVIQRERAGYYGGKTVQVVPHITDHVIAKIFEIAERKVLHGRECHEFVHKRNEKKIDESGKKSKSKKESQKKAEIFNNQENTHESHDCNLSSKYISSNRCDKNNDDSNIVIDISDKENSQSSFTHKAESTKAAVNSEKLAPTTPERSSKHKKGRLIISELSHSPDYVSKGALLSANSESIPINIAKKHSLRKQGVKKLKVLNSLYEKNRDATIYETSSSNDTQPIYDDHFIKQECDDPNFLRTSNEALNELREGGLCGHECNNTLESPDICIIELGGTIGDIESSMFVEALRQLKHNVGHKNFITISVEYVPILPNDEIKTKPVQNSIVKARGLGLQPDIVVVRSSSALNENAIDKIARFGELASACIFQSPDVSSVYKVPYLLKKQGFGTQICSKLSITPRSNQSIRQLFSYIYTSYPQNLTIGLVGKYIRNTDTYISLTKALLYSTKSQQRNLKIEWIDPEELEKDSASEIQKLKSCRGVIIAGGFGKRGSEGMVCALKITRESHIPTLGICLGFQMQVIEYARNILGITDATSQEFCPNAPNHVVRLINMKDNLICGTKQHALTNDSIMHKIYSKDKINERYRHRYEFNKNYAQLFTDKGMIFSGSLVESERFVTLEVPSHPFYVGVQYHPEFLARPEHTHPLFDAFITNCVSK